jgi:hypothetical protein
MIDILWYACTENVPKQKKCRKRQDIRKGFFMRNSGEKCYIVQYINFLSLDFSVIFSCICVDLEDLDGGSEIQHPWGSGLE